MVVAGEAGPSFAEVNLVSLLQIRLWVMWGAGLCLGAGARCVQEAGSPPKLHQCLYLTPVGPFNSCWEAMLKGVLEQNACVLVLL